MECVGRVGVLIIMMYANELCFVYLVNEVATHASHGRQTTIHNIFHTC